MHVGHGGRAVVHDLRTCHAGLRSPVWLLTACTLLAVSFAESLSTATQVHLIIAISNQAANLIESDLIDIANLIESDHRKKKVGRIQANIMMDRQHGSQTNSYMQNIIKHKNIKPQQKNRIFTHA